MPKEVQNNASHRQSPPGSYPTRLILLPGLAADERMYSRVKDALRQMDGDCVFELETPRLLAPRARESMQEYALRTADILHVGAADIIGGCSFGSMVASAMAAQTPVKGLILLSGALDSSTLVHSSRTMNRIAPLIPFALLQRMLASDWFLRSVFGEGDPADIELGRSMLLDTPEQTLRRGGLLATTATLAEPPRVPVYALHGSEDRVLRPPEVENCQQVARAGHGMVVSHPHEVADFLTRTVCRMT